MIQRGMSAERLAMTPQFSITPQSNAPIAARINIKISHLSYARHALRIAHLACMTWSRKGQCARDARAALL
jgi:hypothetical protein